MEVATEETGRNPLPVLITQERNSGESLKERHLLTHASLVRHGRVRFNPSRGTVPFTALGHPAFQISMTWPASFSSTQGNVVHFAPGAIHDLVTIAHLLATTPLITLMR